MFGHGDANGVPWWVGTPPRLDVDLARFRAVAYYRHSAQDRQENSVQIQQDQVRQWAAANGVKIIHEFADRGKSGLTAEGRHAFNDMMENWVAYGSGLTPAAKTSTGATLIECAQLDGHYAAEPYPPRGRFEVSQ